MELRHLRYFLAVAENQGFRKAAQTLRVSHPSLCEQIIDLENEVGVQLFARSHHRVALTAAGHIFLAGARRTLTCALQAVDTAQQASRDHRGELRIASVGLMCPSLLASLICAFRQRFPKVEISILQEGNFKSIEALERRADLAIGFLPAESMKGATLKSWIIAAAPIGIAVRATIGPEQRSAAKLQDFADQPFLILDPKYALGYLEWTRSVFVRTDFEPVKTIPVSTAEVFFTLIRAGVGVGLLSPLHIEGQGADIHFRKLTEPMADFPLSLVWEADRGSPLVNDFLAVARPVLQKPAGAHPLNNRNRSVVNAY